MDTKKRNEKKFIWQDIKFFTVYGRIQATSDPGSFHMHSQYELFVFKSAKGYMQTDNGKIKLSGNSAILIPPRTNHALVLDEALPALGITISFNYKIVNDYKHQNSEQLFTFFDNLMPKQNQIIILKDKYFGQFYHSFFSENEANPLLASSLINHMLEGLFLHILRKIKHSDNSEEKVPIYSYTTRALSNEVIVARAIDDYMSTPGCTLEALAEYLKMSPRNVQRILKKLYNKSFTERLAEIRLSRAVHLMSNKSYSLNEIAEKANYNKYDSFRKAFIAKYGMSPSEYRETLG